MHEFFIFCVYGGDAARFQFFGKQHMNDECEKLLREFANRLAGFVLMIPFTTNDCQVRRKSESTFCRFH